MAPPSEEQAISTLATPVLSVAVHVMTCDSSKSQYSPPFGLVTVTTGAWLSIGAVPGGPAATGSVTLPVPPAAALASPMLNSVPVVALGPEALPSSEQSTVYEPPPWSTTWYAVDPAELRNVPSVRLEVP